MFHTNRVIERGKSTHTKPIWSTANMHMKTFISISPHRGILRLAGCNYKSSSCLKISRVAARGNVAGFQKIGNKRKIKGLLRFTIEQDWPLIKFKNAKIYCYNILKQIKVGDMQKQFELESKLQ